MLLMIKKEEGSKMITDVELIHRLRNLAQNLLNGSNELGGTALALITRGASLDLVELAQGLERRCLKYPSAEERERPAVDHGDSSWDARSSLQMEGDEHHVPGIVMMP